MNAIENNKRAGRESTRVFKNEHNVDGIGHLFAKDFKHHFAPPIQPGPEGFKAVGRMMNHAFPDVVVAEEDLIANDTTVVERSSAAATHKGDFMGRAPRGEESGGRKRQLTKGVRKCQNRVRSCSLSRKPLGAKTSQPRASCCKTIWEFRGPIDTFHKADDYLQAIQKLSAIVEGVDILKVFEDGNDVGLFCDLKTKTVGISFVAEWYQVKDGKIASVRVIFDARPFAAMFAQRASS